MKSRTLMALAVAGTFACGGAFAGGTHGKHHSATEVTTPMSVNESAPWLANQPHSAGWSDQGSSSTIVGMQDSLHGESFVGASSDLGGSGYGGFDSSSVSSHSGFDSSLTGFDHSLSGVDYWLWGDEIYGTGASSSAGGSGYGGFESSSLGSDQSFDSMSGLGSDDSFASAEQYLVWGPLSEADADDLMLIEGDSESASSVSLAALSEGYTLLTPIYDEIADAGMFGSDTSYQVSEYSPLSGEEDSAT